VVFLGRLHPIKNLPVLLRAWAVMRHRPAGARVVLAGPDEGGHRAQLEALAAELGIAAEVDFIGDVPSHAIAGVLASAWCLVLPSKTENFGNVVTEALACGAPVIASTGTPWASLVERGCGWWVPAEPAALGAAIREALALSVEERQSMGERGRAFAHDVFDVGAVARAMRAWHESIVREARAPGR
jgi:glycosyltransferase involved in cell wall biosynthesis